MDNKNFNADQSIELIQRMIRDTRRNLSSGSHSHCQARLSVKVSRR